MEIIFCLPICVFWDNLGTQIAIFYISRLNFLLCAVAAIGWDLNLWLATYHLKKQASKQANANALVVNQFSMDLESIIAKIRERRRQIRECQ